MGSKQLNQTVEAKAGIKNWPVEQHQEQQSKLVHLKQRPKNQNFKTLSKKDTSQKRHPKRQKQQPKNQRNNQANKHKLNNNSVVIKDFLISSSKQAINNGSIPNRRPCHLLR